MNNLEKFKEQLTKLCANAVQLEVGMLKELGKLDTISNKKEVLEKVKPISFSQNYEQWYTESLAVIKQILPDRLEDFKVIYKNDKRKVTDYLTYTISDYLINLRVTSGYDVKVDSSAAHPKFKVQRSILEACLSRFDSVLFDIKQIVQADLFDSEIETARELLKKGFYRASGAIAGVILEKHFKQVLINRNINFKKNPTISELNDMLKAEGIIDMPQWRQIQYLGDVRNLCDHHKDRDPKKEEVDDLISGTSKILKTIF